MKSGITAHCVVRNEQRWIWFAINSIIDYVDKIFIFDTGSTDNTVSIIKTIKSPKIIFEEKGEVDRKGLTQLRQEMLASTRTPWFLVLDGDEVWTRSAISEVISAISRAARSKHAVIVGQWVCYGDIYHYSEMSAKLRESNWPKGLYGFRLARAIRNLPGLHCIGIYGNESFADRGGVNISDWKNERLIYTTHNFFHLTSLPRSATRMQDKDVMMRGVKTVFQRGLPFPKNTKYPEVFSKKRPSQVSDPWQHFHWTDALLGFWYRFENIFARHQDSQKIYGDT